MKHILLLALAMTICTSSSIFAQSKGQMAFTSSSPNANKLLRSAWVDIADFKIEEGNNTLDQLLKEDPHCAMAYVSLFPSSEEDLADNLKKAESLNLSMDEQMLLKGIMAHLKNAPTQEHFAPLLKKYPSDDYLQLMIMFNSEPEAAFRIGEGLIKRKPKFAPAHNLLGYLYMAKNDMVKAEEHFNKYISLRPELANPYDSKGDFLMTAGKTEEAIKQYEKAASLGMTSSQAKAENAKAQLKFPKPSSDDISTIKTIISEAFDAMKKSDVDKLVKDVSGHIVEIFGDQRANVGLPNLRKRFVGMFEHGMVEKQAFAIEAVVGSGPIAAAYGRNDVAWKESESGNVTEQKNNMIFLLDKQQDGEWKIIADHFYDGTQDNMPLSSEDKTSINKVLAKWDAALEPGQQLTERHLEAFAVQYSPQAIEIFPDQLSNVGLPNLKARWEQINVDRMKRNKLNPLGIEGLGRKAIAWGIANQDVIEKGTGTLYEFEFPWVMILTKEKDNAWKILAIHWGSD